MKTTPLGPFLGISTRRPDFALHVAKEGDYLRSAVNVDIDNAGKLRRRGTPALHAAMTGAHSLFMTGATTALLVRASVLYAVTLPTYAEVLVKILSSNARMSYAVLGDSVYFSNGTDSGRVTSGVAYPMGLPTPTAPTLAAIGGSLAPGQYLVGVAYSNSVTGEVGGISATASLTLTATGGARVTLPAATTGATHIKVYLSADNGDVPTLATTVATGTATADLTTLATGSESTMRLEAPLPAGTLFAHNGRLCSFTGSTVYVGLPFRPGYYLPAEGFIPFPSAVSIAVGNQGGVYVAADKTYFIPGDLGDVQGALVDVLPYGAVPGTEFALSDKTQVGWFGAQGFVLADTQGSAQAVMADNIDVTPPASGVSAVLDCDGYRKVVSCGWCMNLATKAATTYTGWEFTSLTEHFGTLDDGIYLLESAGTVDASIGFGKLDFGSEQRKVLPAVYLGVDATAPMRLRVQAPGAVDYSYDAQSSSADLKIQRIVPGKGLKANWYELTLSNTAGAAFTLATVSFAAADTSRRI